MRAALKIRLAAGCILSGLLLGGCETGTPHLEFELPVAQPQSAASSVGSSLRIYDHPYQAVDWANDLRLKSQHHDHVGTRIDWILAYDAAGYDVVSLMDYSGNVELPYSIRQRLWPVENWVPRTLVSQLRSIKLFLPNAEEVGVPPRVPWDPIKHATSPFLTTYIEGAATTPPGGVDLPLLPNQYRSLEQLFALIRSLDGFPCLAHAWNYAYTQLDLGESYCVEIYNAIGDVNRDRGLPWYTERDRNQGAIDTWDEVLARNQRVFGIAVNDHFGPQTLPGDASARVKDSGKIIVLVKSATLAAYKEAFVNGRYFAVRDYGETKDRYPTINSITVTEDRVHAETTGNVRWIANGRIVGDGTLLLYAQLPARTRYVRAEITNDDGSTVYTQAFAVRPVGDVDGDYDVDADDTAACQSDTAPPSTAAQRACVAARGEANRLH